MKRLILVGTPGSAGVLTTLAEYHLHPDRIVLDNLSDAPSSDASASAEDRVRRRAAGLGDGALIRHPGCPVISVAFQATVGREPEIELSNPRNREELCDLLLGSNPLMLEEYTYRLYAGFAITVPESEPSRSRRAWTHVIPIRVSLRFMSEENVEALCSSDVPDHVDYVSSGPSAPFSGYWRDLLEGPELDESLVADEIRRAALVDMDSVMFRSLFVPEFGRSI